jgi:hypothetical protein
MTKEEIDALEGLRAAGTPGRWVHDGDGYLRSEGDGTPSGGYCLGTIIKDANLDLACAAVNALPALIAEVREAGARELERAAERCDREAASADAQAGSSRRDGVPGSPERWWGFSHAMREHTSWLRSRAASLRKDAR